MSAVIGERAPRSDAAAKVTGDAIYSVDHAEHGMLHGKLLRSPLAAGRITLLDVEQALLLPGVRHVLTAADAPDCRAGWVLREQRLFASDIVRYEGEPVALVVADDPRTARDALDLIRLEIEPTTMLGTIEESLADGAPLIHPDWQGYESAIGVDFSRGGNIAAEMVYDPNPGALAEAFAAAHRVVEDEFRTPRQYQAYLEPKSTIGQFHDGRYIVHTGNQFPFNVRERVAQFLAVGISDVRVLGHHIGGGFGGKLDAALEPYAALAARISHRPVKIVNGRAEDMLTCGSRENAVIRLRTALAADGTILARELECLMDNGAYSGEMPLVASLPLHVLGQVYRTPVARIVSKLVYTHTAPTGAFRGVCGTYLTFAIERHMDNCALALALDRREFRLQNLVSNGAQMFNGQLLEDAGLLREAFDRVEELAPWNAAGAGSDHSDRLRGVGIAAVTWFTNPLPGSVMLKLSEDGTIGVVTAATENGSGAMATGVRQIIAAELGVDPESVIVPMPDTDVAGYDAGSQGSRTTHIVGRAASMAAEEMRGKIFAVASDLLEVSADDLELGDHSVRVKGDPGSGLPLASVAAAATWTVGPITGTGSYTTAAPSHNPGCASGLLWSAISTPTYHVHLAVVDVDRATGEIDVVRYVAAQEVGKAINPDGVRGQIQGGIVQGLGHTLYENIQIVDGRYLERCLETYRLPLAVDAPNVEIILLEHPDRLGPYGAKGAAEPPILPVAAAVANAVSDAIGHPITRLPVTPEDVLAALDLGEPASSSIGRPRIGNVL